MFCALADITKDYFHTISVVCVGKLNHIKGKQCSRRVDETYPHK